MRAFRQDCGQGGVLLVKRNGPLSGIRVVDFGHYIAGPLTGMLLADQGADVIKVDRPHCARSKTPESAVFNRNKRRIELDLKNDADRDTAKALVASADVVIENFRPGVMKRLGLDAETLTALHPRLIYLSLPGFASTDRDNASIRAFEGVIGAATGLFTDPQELRRLLGGRPVYTPVPVASTYGAIHGATAVTLALYHREKTGQGEQIEVPLAAAALSALAIINMKIENKPNHYDAPALTTEEERLVPEWRELVDEQGDKAIAAIGAQITDQNQPTTANYQAADGRWLYFVGSGHGPNTRGILKALGLYEDLIQAGMVDLPVLENLHLTNNIADGPGWSRVWNRHVRSRIQEVVAQKPAKSWEQELVANGLPAVAHLSSREWLNAPETHEAGLIVDVADPMFGSIHQIGVQTTLSSSPETLTTPGPCIDVQLEDVIGGHEKPRSLAATPKAAMPILDGLRVLDLSNVLAGPVSGRTLAEYGADVVKIDPPNPNFGPRISHMFPIEASPGKRSLILDIKSPAGHAVFRDLVKSADVVIHNFRPGAPKKMNIDYDSLKAINPDLIYLNVTAFNGPRPGPWMDRAGFDPVLQAATGIQTRYGGKNRPPTYHGWASCIDYITGFSGAFGVALSLFRNKRGPVADPGDLVTTSLAQGAQLVQASLLIGIDGLQPGAEAEGQDAVGEHALYRFYQASDGWVFIAAERSEPGLLADVQGIEMSAKQMLSNNQGLQAFLEQAIALRPVAHWVNAFHNAGIGASRVDTLEDVRDRYLHEGSTIELQKSWDDGRTLAWVRFNDHPSGGAVELAAPAYARLKNTPVELLYPTPKQGAHTQEILAECGLDEDAIAKLLDNGTVKIHQHPNYLPG